MALEWQLLSLLSLEARLAPAAPLAGATPSARLPEREVRFEAVGFSYLEKGRPVFDALDLQVTAGRSTALVGANGAGKTTLVKLL